MDAIRKDVRAVIETWYPDGTRTVVDADTGEVYVDRVESLRPFVKLPVEESES